MLAESCNLQYLIFVILSYNIVLGHNIIHNISIILIQTLICLMTLNTIFLNLNPSYNEKKL